MMSREYETDRRGSHSGLAFGVGVVAGALLGVGLGLLFAPKSGAALRRDVARKMREVQDDAAEQFERVSEAADEFVDRSRDVARRAQSAVAAGIRDARRYATEAVDSIDKSGA